MSLRFGNAKMPSLRDKIASQRAEAEKVQEKAEKKDLSIVKIIKKLSPKKKK